MSRRLVVDASVAVKWYLDEPRAQAVRGLLDGPFRPLVPGSFFAEVGNLLWKRWRRGELSGEDIGTTLDALDPVPLRVQPTRVLLSRAIEIATAHGRSVYDSLYLALAVEESARMVTADRKLFDAVAGGPARSAHHLGRGPALGARAALAPYSPAPIAAAGWGGLTPGRRAASYRRPDRAGPAGGHPAKREAWTSDCAKSSP